MSKKRKETFRQGEDLKAAFTEAFGIDGQHIVTDLIESGRLNGGIDLSGRPISEISSNDGDYYPGVSYAHATGFYFMRRALDMMNADDAYAEFLLDVDTIDGAYNLKEVNDRYPTQDWMESLCKPYFERLEESQNPKAAPGF